MIMNDMESDAGGYTPPPPPQHLPALPVVTTTAGAAGAATGHATITTPIKPVLTGDIQPTKGGNVNPPPKLPPVTTDKGGGIAHAADVIVKDISTATAAPPTQETPCNGCKKDAAAEPKKKKWLFVAVGVIVVIVLIRIFK